MKTDQLILDLASTSTPVRPLASPLVRGLKWFAAAFFCLGGALFFLKLRPTISSDFGHFHFSAQAFAILAVAVMSALSAFILSVPDKLRSYSLIVPLVTLGVWLVMILVPLFSSQGSAGMGWPCVSETLVLGLVPGGLMFYMIRRAAPLRIFWAGLFAALAATAIGGLGTHLTCQSNSAMHLLVWHFLPVLVAGGIGLLLGRWLLSKN